MGTILFFPIDCVWERVLGPFVSETVISLLKILKMFYPPMALCVTEPNWVHLTVFPYYCGWETVLILSKSPFSIGLFEILKLFYPHKGILRSKTQWGGVHLTVIPFYCVWEGVFWPFVSEAVIRLFKILKMFYTRWECAMQIPKEVQLFLLMSYFVSGNVYWTFKFWTYNPPF